VRNGNGTTERHNGTTERQNGTVKRQRQHGNRRVETRRDADSGGTLTRVLVDAPPPMCLCVLRVDVYLHEVFRAGGRRDTTDTRLKSRYHVLAASVYSEV